MEEGMVIRYMRNEGIFLKFRLSVRVQWDLILFGRGERFAIRTGQLTLGKTTLIRNPYLFSLCHIFNL